MNAEVPKLSDHSELFIPFFDAQEIYSSLIAQINKDFNRAGIDYSFEPNIHYGFDELSALIAQQMTKAISSSGLSLANLLYVIDVDEKFTKESASSDLETVQFLAELIIKRELQKVILRQRFK